jgi:hypothetical protein
MAPMPTSSFDMSRVPMGGWNLPLYGSNTSYALSGASTQMGAYPTYYTPPMYLSSAMSVPSNTFSMTGPQVPPGLSYGENQFYGSGYPLYGTPSQGGNIYPHSNNSYPTSVSSQTSVTMPVQTSSDHFGIGHHFSGQGQGVHQDPSWPAIFQNQSFPGPWNQMPQSIASPVTVSHTGAPSPTSASHVGDGSTFSTNYVDNLPPTSANYVGGTILFTPNHSRVTSPASIHHTGDDSLSPASYIEKPRRLRRKPKFLCRTCEGSHLTRLCPVTTGIPEAWGSPKSPSDSEASMVSPHTTSPLIVSVVPPTQSSPDLTPFVKGEASLAPVTMHPLQPIIEEVATPVQSLVNPTLPEESDAPFSHVINIPNPPPSERERFILPPNALPPSPDEVPFDWDDLMGHPIPPPMSFPLRDIIRTITETVSSVSTFSSSTWRALGFPKLLSAIREILTFRRRPRWEPWPPPLHVD